MTWCEKNIEELTIKATMFPGMKGKFEEPLRLVIWYTKLGDIDVW